MTIGRHAIADLYNCNSLNLDNLDYIKNLILQSAKEANLTVVNSVFHKFNPIGISGVLILSESHLTIHTWPEYNYVAIDVFTCGKKINPTEACEIIAKKFNASVYSINELERGSEYAISRIGN